MPFEEKKQYPWKVSLTTEAQFPKINAYLAELELLLKFAKPTPILK